MNKILLPIFLLLAFHFGASAEDYDSVVTNNPIRHLESSEAFKTRFVNSLQERVVSEFERLEDLNFKNEETGNAKSNNYLIDIGSFNIENGVWITEFSSKSEGNLLRIPSFKRVNERLQKFNTSRSDDLRLYVIVSLDFKAYLKSDLIPTGEEWVNRANLEKFFNDDDVENILSFVGSELPLMIDQVDQALEAKGYSNRLIYSYTLFQYLTPDFQVNSYKLEWLNVAAAPDQGTDENGNVVEVPSKLENSIDAIRSKARQKFKKGQTYGEYVEQVVENIIAAIEIEYDRKESISKTGVTNCGKPVKDLIKETWPLSPARYQESILEVASVYDLKDQIEFDELNSPYVLVDDIENFEGGKKSELSLSDPGFIQSILPDKLNLMKGRSDYQIVAIFKSVDFVIPFEQRAEFAKDVYLSSNYLRNGAGKTILLVVPYFYCKDNAELAVLDYSNDLKAVYPMLFMPAVYGPDQALTMSMNAALIREPSFRSGFDQAFKNVPKMHTAFLAYLNWDGSLVFKEDVEKESTRSSNFFDVFIFVDDRLNMIQEHLKCYDNYSFDISFQGSGDGKIQAPYNPYGKTPYQQYKECVKLSQSSIEKILADNPDPKYKELNAKQCNLRQGKFVELGETELAMRYVMASIGLSEKRFWVGLNGSSTYGKKIYDKEHMDDNLFYDKKNPVKEKFWLLSIIDVASLAASFVGLDFVFDLTGGAVSYMIGDNQEAAIYFASVLVPASITVGVKYFKNPATIGQRIVSNYRNAKAFLLRRGKGGVVAVSTDVATASGKPIIQDGTEILRAVGVSSDNALASAKQNPDIIEDIEESIIVLEEGMVKKKPVEGKYSPENIVDRVNTNPRIVEQYKVAKQSAPDLDFVKFLKKVDDAPSVCRIGKFSGIPQIKDEENFFTLLISKVEDDGKVVLANGERLDAAAIAKVMEASGYQPGSQIRIISILDNGNPKTTEKLANELAERYGTVAKTHNQQVVITESGELLAKNGELVSWTVADYGYLPSPSEMILGRTGQEGMTTRDFVVVAQKVKPDGSVVCKVNGQLKTVTPSDLAKEMKTHGLRHDDLPLLVLSASSLPVDHQNLKRTADMLAGELNTVVRRSGDPEIFFNSAKNGIAKKGFVDQIGATQIDPQWIVSGNRKPLLVLTEANHSVDDFASDAYTVVVESISKNGKVKYKTKELDHLQFIKLIKEEGEYAGKPIRIISKKADDEGGMVKFLAGLSEEAKVSVRVNKAPITAVDDGIFPLQGVEWLVEAPLGKGRRFVNANLNSQYLKKLGGFEPEFVELFGQGLSQNGGKYVKQFLDNPEWLERIYADYKLTSGKSVSIPVFVDLQQITNKLEVKFFDDPWVVDLRKKSYEVPLLAKNLNSELNWLEKEALEELASNSDLRKRVIDLVEDVTKRNGTGTVRHFLAANELLTKLPKEMVDDIVEQFGQRGEFLPFLSKEINKLDQKTLDKFKRYHRNSPEDFLSQFVSLHQTPGRSIGLTDYMAIAQRKNQVFLAGQADNTLKDVADQLVPQEGYMDVFLRTDGENFIEVMPNGSKQIVAPEDVARDIRQNEFWEDRPLRLVVRGETPAVDVKQSSQRLIDDLEAEGSKINPKNDFALTEEGKLASRWEPISPQPVGEIVKETRSFSDPRMLAGLGNDQATIQAVTRLKTPPSHFDVVVHGDITKSADGQDLFWVLRDGKWLGLSHRDLYKWLSRQPGFKDAKTIRLITCGSASTFSGAERALAQNFANKSGKSVLAAGGEIGVAKSGEVVAQGAKEDQWWRFEKATSATSSAPVPQGKIRKASSADDALSLKFTNQDPYSELKENVTYLDWYEQLISGETRRKYEGILNLEEETALNWYVREGPSLNYEMVFGTTPLTGFDLIMRNTISDALGKLKVYNQPVFRGMGKAEFEFIQKAYNSSAKEVVFKDFKSTSKLESVAETFNKSEGNGVQYIGVFHSHAGIDISATRPGMEEVLLPHNSKFRIKSIEDDGKGIIKVHFEDAAIPERITERAVHSPEIEKAFGYFESKPDASYQDFLQGLQSGSIPRLYPNELSIKQEAVLRHFAADGNHAVNDAILGITGRKLTADLKGEMDIVNDALKKLPKHRGGVFRGAGLAESKRNAELLDRGATELEFDQFLYTTKNEERAIDYLTHGGDRGYMVYQIRPKSAVDVSNFTDASNYWQELISPARTRYRVVDRKEIKIADGRVIDYVFLEEL